ncbi:glycosyltransferase family 4 protein [Oceanicola sp. 502str15]|uniref:glycosyltransferase family 4 protein n=1 Tax=Oceanicola sp. 502str15 TaxID=2696061 RepID=UPI002095FC39|nr:glycosyltransferase family 4 protein [Oceanicola sp. 502str15]MCO6383263.1 glycosyltransferase [Oceanicola sp. 502str15]
MSDPLKITFVTRKWPPAMGGMETYAQQVSTRLKEYGEVEVIALPGHPDGSAPTPWELLRFGAKTALSLLFSRDPAPVVHVADMASWPLALFARLRRPSVRRILSAHGTDVSYPARGGLKGRLYGTYLRLGAKLLGRVTVIANSAATASAAGLYGYRDVVIVPLAAEARLQGEAPAPEMQTLLFCGRLTPLKGFRWFVENVLPLLPEPMVLEVAGTVWDETEGAALSAPRVRHLGRLDQPALYQRMAAALCVVVPNIHLENGQFEGFGLVATEAAAVGGVVVAARHAGLKDAVKDGETGFLVTPGDAEAWAREIKRVAGWSAEERADFVAGSKATAARYYNWDRVARDTARQFVQTP